jgi:hypothetical protein
LKHRPELTQANSLQRTGQGDWAPIADGVFPLEAFHEAARGWAKTLEGIEKPWLCWNMSPTWCLIQQKLVKHVGWTPVVGLDPKYDAPQLVPGAIQVDFNATLKLPQMYCHVPIDLMWLYAPRLAFWHSDLLCRFSFMEDSAAMFEKLPDGEMAAVWDYSGLRRIFQRDVHRYYELIGCMTRGASRNNFENGCGWWRSIECHPNAGDAAERARRRNVDYDHGFGIMYWKRNYGGRVRNISLRKAAEGHCSEIGNSNYKVLDQHTAATRLTGKEMELNYDIEQVCRKLGIQSLL